MRYTSLEIGGLRTRAPPSDGVRPLYSSLTDSIYMQISISANEFFAFAGEVVIQMREPILSVFSDAPLGDGIDSRRI